MAKKPRPVPTRVQELVALIEAQKMMKRVITSDVSNPARVEREITRLRERIARDMHSITEYQDRIDNGPQRLRDCDARIRELRQELVVEQNKAEIAKLLDLQKKLLGED